MFERSADGGPNNSDNLKIDPFTFHLYSFSSIHTFIHAVYESVRKNCAFESLPELRCVSREKNTKKHSHIHNRVLGHFFRLITNFDDKSQNRNKWLWKRVESIGFLYGGVRMHWFNECVRFVHLLLWRSVSTHNTRCNGIIEPKRGEEAKERIMNRWTRIGIHCVWVRSAHGIENGIFKSIVKVREKEWVSSLCPHRHNMCILTKK